MKTRLRDPSKKHPFIVLILSVLIISCLAGLSYELWLKPYVMGYIVEQKVDIPKPSQKAVSKDNKDVVYGDNNTAISSLSELMAHRNGTGTLLTRGHISIPVQNGVQSPIEVPIFEGASNYVLAYGAGTLKPHQKMGTGNYSLGAHNVANNTSLFSPLQSQIDVSQHPIAYVSDDKHTYRYQLTSYRKVNRQTKGLLTDTDKPTLTLITCYLVYPNFYDAVDRVVVTGELIGQE